MGQRDIKHGGRRALDHALDAVGLLGATDAVVVPATPTADMLLAGAQTGSVSPEIAGRIYRAMVLIGGR